MHFICFFISPKQNFTPLWDMRRKISWFVSSCLGLSFPPTQTIRYRAHITQLMLSQHLFCTPLHHPILLQLFFLRSANQTHLFCWNWKLEVVSDVVVVHTRSFCPLLCFAMSYVLFHCLVKNRKFKFWLKICRTSKLNLTFACSASSMFKLRILTE